MSEIKTYIVTEPYLKLDCGLGEAPFWEVESHTLRFVDIVKQKLHLIDLNKGPTSHKAVDLEVSIGTTAEIPGDQENFAFVGKGGYGVFTRSTGAIRYVRKYWEGELDSADKEKKFRGNDGGVDSRGRYWAGIMRDPLVNEPTDDGIVFCLDPDLTLHRKIEGVSIPNGLSWSADDKTMYLADSPTKQLIAYDYDIETGSISNRRVVYQVNENNGVPDGHAIDEAGCIWQCVHGRGKVIRLSPQGEVLAQILLPTRCVTCPAFVGEDLFITSAEDEFHQEPETFPNSPRYQGSLFRCRVGVRGQRPHSFKLPQ